MRIPLENAALGEQQMQKKFKVHLSVGSLERKKRYEGHGQLLTH